MGVVKVGCETEERDDGGEFVEKDEGCDVRDGCVAEGSHDALEEAWEAGFEAGEARGWSGLACITSDVSESFAEVKEPLGGERLSYHRCDILPLLDIMNRGPMLLGLLEVVVDWPEARFVRSVVYHLKQLQISNGMIQPSHGGERCSDIDRLLVPSASQDRLNACAVSNDMSCLAPGLTRLLQSLSRADTCEDGHRSPYGVQ